MKKLFVLSILLLTQLSFAKEDVLATISNDENKDIYKIVVASDDNGDIKNFFKDNYQGSTRAARTQLESTLLVKNGLTLEQRGDYKVIALKSYNFDRIQGGIITIDTLFNGAKGERKNYDISLAKDKYGWKLYKGNQNISKIHLEINKLMLIGTVGIKNVKME